MFHFIQLDYAQSHLPLGHQVRNQIYRERKKRRLKSEILCRIFLTSRFISLLSWWTKEEGTVHNLHPVEEKKFWIS